MVQRELAERLVAAPGSRQYGAPTVLLQDAADVRLCFQVPAGAFVPRPRVDSAVLRLDLREARRSAEVDEAQLSRTVHAAFGQRRKTLRRALESGFDAEQVRAALAQTGIDPGRRGETLAVEEFGALAAALANATSAQTP